ncbi:hypothetical protein CYMTET_46196 [Cymbomonas tetramitiformis]|uniref:Reverse transcriptase domain-containing protein n=1 Tax=Cymbomonas tetramitiformis TaxID=36881 RepID=A0AAE0BWM8_9CHLO|nr:hypothetical protein CYMTET_46196 [Cymbomonas tetramitiformis]
MSDDQGISQGDGNAPRPEAPAQPPTVDPALMALFAQQTTLIQTLTQRVEALNMRVEEEVAAKATSAATAQSGDAELEALRQLPYVPHVAGNPFPARPATLETDMPQMYDLYNDKTYDALCKRTNSSMRYEHLVLAPALSYLHDAVAYNESTMDWMDDASQPPTLEEMGTEGLVTDSVLSKWLKEFDTTKAKAVMRTHAKASAKISTFRDRPGAAKNKGGKGEGGRGNGKGAGANSKLPRWISKGANMKWIDKAPLHFDHGVSLADATPQQLEWMDAETQRCLGTGAWCGALPFGWNDSPRIFLKVMRVLVECLRSPASAADRREVRKLRGGSFVRQRWAARRRAGGCGREEHQQGSRVLPYMDDFLVLASSKIEALRARELMSRVLVRLGIGRNEKKGHWEPMQLVEHLGLEVDLKAGQFRVTSARLQKIHQQARALLSEATRQRRWLPARRLAAFAALCQAVYLAVPPARLYLREIHFVISTKRRIWRSPARAKLHTDSSLFAWGGADVVPAAGGIGAVVVLPSIPVSHYMHSIRQPTVQTSVQPQVQQQSLVQGSRVRVQWPIDDAWHHGTVGETGADGLTHVVYDDGDKEDLDMSKEKFEVVPAAVQQASTWDAALQERWRGELGPSSLTELAVQMQGAALGGATVGNYRPKAQAFMQFCQGQQRQCRARRLQ